MTNLTLSYSRQQRCLHIDAYLTSIFLAVNRYSWVFRSFRRERRLNSLQPLVLLYLVCLVCAVIIRQKRDPQVWHSDVVEFYRSEARHGLNSTPSSPILPRFCKEPELIAPQPRLPPPKAVYAYRSGMGPEYQIEHFRPSSPAAERPVLPNPIAAPQQYTRTALTSASAPAPSLYPQSVHSTLTTRQPTRPSAASPPPLGDWPRPNAVDQPARNKRKPPPAPLEFPSKDTSGTVASVNSSLSQFSRPRVPRKGSYSTDARRPPPLDLTKISAFRSTGRNGGT